MPPAAGKRHAANGAPLYDFKLLAAVVLRVSDKAPPLML
jgi:hypothetical protein